eukprot:1655988-Rhodomonas_salina.1
MGCRSVERGEQAKKVSCAISWAHMLQSPRLILRVPVTGNRSAARSEHSVKGFAAAMQEEHPHLDVLINNAGVGQLGRVPRTKQEVTSLP